MANTGLATYGRPADEKYFSVAPAGTELPTASDGALAAAYVSVRVSEDGITPAPDFGKDNPVKDWAGEDVLAAPASPSVTLEVPMIDNNEMVHKILYGAANVNTAGSTFKGDTDEWVVVVTELHNDADGNPESIVRTVYPRCVPQEWDEGAHTRTELIVHTVTFQCLYSDTIEGYFRELPAATAE